ncbi:Hypothetical protein FKW44_009065 [Caligus rogercresseyi]|uniref:Uncharacterized protein n=1 Tax=Caligus rogercresseyi TaxID=217165 RepID=A0A7T8K725_CALRO|nr:Hypothetical protein FKW44_009065 [Caligus rogercresseyi]
MFGVRRTFIWRTQKVITETSKPTRKEAISETQRLTKAVAGKILRNPLLHE